MNLNLVPGSQPPLSAKALTETSAAADKPKAFTSKAGDVLSDSMIKARS